jgi:large subunit ribosomal protein L5
MAARLKERYNQEIVGALMRDLNLQNPMEVPKVEKIVLNIGMGEALQNSKSMDAAVGDLTAIAGQKPVVTRARKSIANFKLRQGQGIGAMVTLRGERMYEFLDRLVTVALPRIRDFRGLSRRAFDGRGNYNIGLREQIVFPEINYDQVDKLRGLEVAIVTTARTDEEGYALLKQMGMPFRD